MKISVHGMVLAAFSWLSASPVFALINGELLIGKRWSEQTSGDDKFNAQALEKTIGVMVDPIPFVPVAFGLYYSMPDWKKEDFRAKSVDSNELGASFRAWLPVGDFKPYARLNYTLASSLNFKASEAGVETKVAKSLSGMHLNAGIEYDLLGPVNILAEFGLGMQQIETKEVKVGGVKQDVDNKKHGWNSKTILIGISAGI